jgi:hypothetical protein
MTQVTRRRVLLILNLLASVCQSSRVLAICVLGCFGSVFAQSNVVTAAREYFRYTRDAAISQAAKQNYLIVDAAIWAHARGDLSDVRLYDHEAQVPYKLSEEQSASSTDERPARILNLGVRSGRTEFDLDIGGEAEYNRVLLHLQAANFVATATTEGRDALGVSGETTGRKLSTSTLYDFSREALGNHFALNLPLSTFRYLHVSITPAILPRNVAGASTSVQREAQTAWISAGRCHSPEQAGRVTRIVCDLDPGVPVGRILFTVPSAQVNFRRSYRVRSVAANGDSPQASELGSGSISRIRMKSGGREVVTEELAPSFYTRNESQNVFQVLIEIDNGDNTPLTVEKVEPQSVERRIYFDPAGRTAISLYYGDEKLPAPDYDYAKFFNKDADAAQAILGVESQNPNHTRRPDERPWSERHQWVMWGTMLLAVAVLAALALKGLTSRAPAAK